MELTLQKKLVIGIIIIVAFMYAVFTISAILTKPAPMTNGSCSPDLPCPHEQQLNFLYEAVPLIAALSVAVGAITYYLMAGRVESKEKTIKKNTGVLLQFLNPDEKKVVDKLIEGNGKALQAELTRLPGMTKVKSHRIVQRLIDRKVIETEQLGKTKIVRFTKEIKEGLL